MFRKLKEKIAEEVKCSPQRFQQLTRSVSERLLNSTKSNGNFLSNDAIRSGVNYGIGFTNVSITSQKESRFRRNSNSCIANDISFLPRYEPLANLYHLQSDLEVSDCEIEDNASTSLQLGHLSKQQIYSAFQKSQMRYHKYRERYIDLAKHYKELEREHCKINSVLVETQDKAIRRVTELKEQCLLQQRAKAHLEGALRDEIDDKEFKIQSQQTKIELLKNGIGLNRDSETVDTLNERLTNARQEIKNLKKTIQEMKTRVVSFQAREHEYKTEIANLEKEISLFSYCKKENNLTLHKELLREELSNELSSFSDKSKHEHLQTENKTLIEKMEHLTQKCIGYQNDLLKMERLRIETENLNEMNADLKNRLKEADDNLEKVREKAKNSLFSLEGKIRDKLEKEFEKKEENIQIEFQKKLEEIVSNTNSLEEIQFSLFEKDGDIKKLREANEELLEEITNQKIKYDDLERHHLKLIEESVQLKSKIDSLEKALPDAGQI